MLNLRLCNCQTIYGHYFKFLRLEEVKLGICPSSWSATWLAADYSEVIICFYYFSHDPLRLLAHHWIKYKRADFSKERHALVLLRQCIIVCRDCMDTYLSPNIFNTWLKASAYRMFNYLELSTYLLLVSSISVCCRLNRYVIPCAIQRYWFS